MKTYADTSLRMCDCGYPEAVFASFPWFPLRNQPPAKKENFDFFQQPLLTNNPGIDAVPIRSIEPVFELAKNREFEANLLKDKNNLPAAKSSTQYAPRLLRAKPLTKNCPAPIQAKKQTDPGANTVSKNVGAICRRPRKGLSMDPWPFCSCTGVARRCYSCGRGGWQSSCCTSFLSEYPLPMTSSRPVRRMAGRKMSNGAFRKVLKRLADEGYNFSQGIDLKYHWARHGTNKYVIIR